MKEPSAEDLSYLSDDNIEFCLDYYAREHKRRNRRKARTWAKAYVLTCAAPDDDEDGVLPIAHRHIT